MGKKGKGFWGLACCGVLSPLGAHLTERDRKHSRDKVTSVRNNPYEEIKTGHCVWEEGDSGKGQH